MVQNVIIYCHSGINKINYGQFISFATDLLATFILKKFKKNRHKLIKFKDMFTYIQK